MANDCYFDMRIKGSKASCEAWVNKIIAVDFDGTLCANCYPDIGSAKERLIDFLKIRKNKYGDKIILWTCRVGKHLDDAVAWCNEHGLYFDAVNENLPEIIEKFGGDTRKIFANYYIDDGVIDPIRLGMLAGLEIGEDYLLSINKKLVHYKYEVNGGTGEVVVDEHASDDDIKLKIMDDLYDVTYEKIED